MDYVQSLTNIATIVLAVSIGLNAAGFIASGFSLLPSRRQMVEMGTSALVVIVFHEHVNVRLAELFAVIGVIFGVAAVWIGRS